MENHLMTLFVIFLIFSHSFYTTALRENKKCECENARINRRGFPQDFIFGAASSAYQYEGAYNENGKGLGLWDYFTHMYQDKISDHSNGDIALDSYHRYKEDVQIAKSMGLDAYRFSVSWSRILPGGKISRGVNRDGVYYYNNLINELLANGIEPILTIVHFDVPKALQDAYGGFLSHEIVGDLRDFADLLFCHFGDRVKYWITINEPWTFSTHGYADGEIAPGRSSDWQGLNCTGGDSATEPYIITHNQILAHAEMVNLYRTKYQNLQKGKIGITLVSYWFEAYNMTDENQKTTYRALDFMLGWFMEPLTFGEYPESMRVRVGSRLPEFSKEEADMVKGSFDFLGLNYYGAIYASHSPNSTSSCYITDSEVYLTGKEQNGIPIGEQGRNSSWLYIYPKGLKEFLLHVKTRYNDPLIYITENGLDEAKNDSLPISEALKDDMRIEYLYDHLCCLQETIEEHSVNVKAYIVWSLMDNFEWCSGYTVRFGLNYVDYRDNMLTRYPKSSDHWFRSILMTGILYPQSRTSDQ